jgi:hypothetical protein
MVLYGTGMRRTEVSGLRVSDIDSQRMTTIDDFAVLAECAVMAPDVLKVNSDRHADPALLRGIFEMKYCGCFFIRIASLVSERPTHLTLR